jgi:hypothetical protein
MRRTWQSRKILWTKEILYFFRARENIPIDLIPLHEILSVSAMRDAAHKEHDHNSQEHEHTPPDEIWTWRKMVIEKSNESDAGELADDMNPVLSQYEALLQVKTVQQGFNSGRTYYIHADSEHHREQVVQELTKASAKSLARKLAASRFRSSQRYVRAFYESARFQILVGVLILTVSPHHARRIDRVRGKRSLRASSPPQNFLVNATEAQYTGELLEPDGSLSALGQMLEKADAIFTVLFAAELVVNLYANWFRRFFKDGWREPPPHTT